MAILDQVESQRRDNEARANEYRSRLDSLARETVEARQKAEEAEAGAAEMDALLQKTKAAFTSERKRLQAVAKSKAEEAKKLEEQYKQLEGEYAEFVRKSEITLSDIVGELVETKFLEMLRESQEVS